MTVTVPSSFDPTSNSDMTNTADTENVKVHDNFFTVIYIMIHTRNY